MAQNVCISSPSGTTAGTPFQTSHDPKLLTQPHLPPPSENNRGIPRSVSSQFLEPPLNKDHAAAVYPHLLSLRAKWETIGTMLQIHRGTLEAIDIDKKDSNDKLLELIAVWLRRHTPPPTWQALADAVQYIDPDKAQEIRTKSLIGQ